MQLLVSDANILIDMEEGGLLAPMFSLDCEFIIPDILYYEELEEQHSHLLEYGLKPTTLTANSMLKAIELVDEYRHTSRNDLFALTLALQEECPLLTGDQALRKAAEKEQITVHGTIWLIEELVIKEKLSKAIARAAYEDMQKAGRRLPWKIACARLEAL